jgi:hypothetical protein
MSFIMNEYEVEDALRRTDEGTVARAAAQTLANLVEWTNSNSDGWAYWRKPSAAAKQLQKLVDSYHPFRQPPIDEDAARLAYRKALTPIKAFRARQGADFEIVSV